ncbi:melanoma-associated antigen 10-like [Myotis daubentonii]|uniref:melanoma-associated antigen 10-like n=1 Tax=Myotis daubentonii TaxID=98922 RepID=UPI0028737512|nr:melanoma-associated antigen 10-like [Myotis daubentonii]
MKKDIAAIKNSKESINSRLEEAEDFSIDLEDKSPQRSTAWSTSVGGSSNQDNKDTSSLQTSADPESLHSDHIDENVTNLVHAMILRYRLRKPITKAEMLHVVNKRDKSQFSVIFKKACKCLEVICGIDVKEVVPATHSYVLVNSLDLTYDEMLSDHQSMPKNGLLIIILGMIFLEGNCAPEEDIWEFLNMMGVYAGREHFIYGEPRNLITRTWVQENYLEYQQVLNSDPPRYQFMWGPRAHAETSKLQVLEFLAKIKGTDPISFSCWYEEALRDEQERAQARIGPVGHAAAMFMAQPLLPQRKNEHKSSLCV